MWISGEVDNNGAVDKNLDDLGEGVWCGGLVAGKTVLEKP
jgi:hypothetical protein